MKNVRSHRHTDSRTFLSYYILRRTGGQDNQPKELFSEKFTDQKLDYIHNNPVEAGIVDKAEEYLYSSARDYYTGKNCGLLEIEFL